MSRYFIQRRVRPRLDDDFYSEDIPRPVTLTVCDHEDVDTGLVDPHGDPIMRAPNPIGFIW